MMTFVGDQRYVGHSLCVCHFLLGIWYIQSQDLSLMKKYDKCSALQPVFVVGVAECRPM